jgi:hypothetical protein
VARAQTVTACVIVRDEERRIGRCLSSLGFCDELLVVDSGSTDRTVEIAERAGARVLHNAWAGFAAQRNFALDNAHGDWVLEVDADEWVSPDLAAELVAFLDVPRPDFSLGALPLRQHFLGRALGPSAHHPFYRPRLLRRGEYRHDERRTVHEGLGIRSRPWVFSHELHHELAGSLGEALGDAWSYARLESRQLSEAAARAVLIGLTVRPAAKFAYGMVGLGGWRDSWPGALKLAIESAADAAVWVRYLVGFALGRRRPRPQEVTDDDRRGATRRSGGDRRRPRRSRIVPYRGLERRRGERRGTAPGRRAEDFVRRLHYGRRAERTGPIRLAAIGGRRAAGAHAAWLAEATAAGAWVVLIEPGGGGRRPGTPAVEDDQRGVRRRRIARLGPLELMRALDAERQLGPLDAVIALDLRCRLLASALPSAVRSYSPVFGPGRPARELVEWLRASTRREG